MYPTDVVKTRAQLATNRQPNMFVELKRIWTEEGPRRLYRGIAPPIMVEAPKRALKFASNDAYKPLFTGANGKLSQAGAIGAGISAGCTEAFLVVPFELVKIRLQAKSNAGKYNGTFDAAKKILQQEGPRAFFNGLESTLWRHAAWNGGYFGLIFTVKDILPPAKSEIGTTFSNFVAGTIAGTFGTVLNTPFDVVKSRIQNQSERVKYNWTLPALQTIAREEGPRALYKGFVPKVVRLGPGGGILLVVFEFVSKKLRQYSEAKVEKR